ncbi:hypothetical protein GCM10010277_68830 [Streptomyces longisporoflavus]|nr:hypothetical protein GCM10010277_68830 [Streptomyces longisporoflavus]
MLGAAVGVIGTLGTATLTYLATRHQVRDQGRVDHAKVLREERKAAYLDFLEAAESCSKVCDFGGNLRDSAAEKTRRRFRGNSRRTIDGTVRDAVPAAATG